MVSFVWMLGTLSWSRLRCSCLYEISLSLWWFFTHIFTIKSNCNKCETWFKTIWKPLLSFRVKSESSFSSARQEGFTIFWCQQVKKGFKKQDPKSKCFLSAFVEARVYSLCVKYMHVVWKQSHAPLCFSLALMSWWKWPTTDEEENIKLPIDVWSRSYCSKWWSWSTQLPLVGRVSVTHGHVCL